MNKNLCEEILHKIICARKDIEDILRECELTGVIKNSEFADLLEAMEILNNFKVFAELIEAFYANQFIHRYKDFQERVGVLQKAMIEAEKPFKRS